MRNYNHDDRSSHSRRIPDTFKERANRKVGGAGSVLSKLFCQMLSHPELNYDDLRNWNNLMQRYITDKRNAIAQNNKDQSSARGNLRKELLKEKMSWNVFVKGMRFMDLEGFEIIIKAHHRNGKITVHSESVGLGDRIEYANAEPTSKPVQLLPGDVIEIKAKHKNKRVTDHVLEVESDMFDEDLESAIIQFDEGIDDEQPDQP
jgi:uncharacterized protein with PIN domain